MNSPAAEEGVCNGYVTAVSVALSGGARTVSINKIWKNLVTFLLVTVSLSPGLTVNNTHDAQGRRKAVFAGP